MTRSQAKRTIDNALQSTHFIIGLLKDARGDLNNNGVNADLLLTAIGNFRVSLTEEREKLT